MYKIQMYNIYYVDFYSIQLSNLEKNFQRYKKKNLENEFKPTTAAKNAAAIYWEQD
jgi:hypothetical protein